MHVHGKEHQKSQRACAALHACAMRIACLEIADHRADVALHCWVAALEDLNTTEPAAIKPLLWVHLQHTMQSRLKHHATEVVPTLWVAGRA